MNISDLYNTPLLLAELPARGVIAMGGKDRAALLQRISTNDVLKLQPGTGVETVLTSPVGRIIDMLTVLARDERLLLITGEGRGGEIATYLRRNIFFMDQVTVEILSGWETWLLDGAEAQATLAQLTGAALTDLARFGHVKAGEVLLARTHPLREDSWMLVGPPEALGMLRSQLERAGARTISAEERRTLEVEAGRPGLPELNQEYIPLEAGLWDAVSFKKGCYIGQEIIARMESRGRIAKKLQGLRLEQLPDALPAPLTVAGKDAGEITSAVVSPRHGPIGLGYVRSAFAEPGTELELGGGRAVVTALPF